MILLPAEFVGSTIFAYRSIMKTMQHVRFWIDTTFGSSPFMALIVLSSIVFLASIVFGW